MKTSFICLAIAILLVCPNLSAQNAGPPLLKKNLAGGAAFPFGYQTGCAQNVPMKVTPPARVVRSLTSGVTHRVPQQYGTIQAAINACSNGDTVLVSEGTYRENIRYYRKAIIVASLYLADGDTTHIAKTVIDGSTPINSDSGSVVSFVDGEDTTSVLCGLTIQGGSGTRAYLNTGGAAFWVRAGGGVLCNGSGARITKNIIAHNRFEATLAQGGGIAAYGTATTVPYVILEGNRISGNYIKTDMTQYCWGWGGGAHLFGVDLRAVDNIFEGDTATGNLGGVAGGMGIGHFSDFVALRLPVGNIIGNVFRSNVAIGSKQGAAGAGLAVQSSGNVTIEGNLFEGNCAKCCSFDPAIWSWAEGAALCVDDQQFPEQGRKVIVNNRFINNSVNCTKESNGGGIFLYLTTATVIGNYFTGNQASSDNGRGAAFGAQASCIRLENNIFTNNHSGQTAGAVWIYRAPYVGTEQLIINNTMAYNRVGWYGSGIGIYYTANVVCLNNICWGDSADLRSPEVNIYEATPVIEYCDIKGGYSGTGNIHADPAFVTGDTLFHLSASSPCIEGGIESAEIDTVSYCASRGDYDGMLCPMPAGTRPDMGAQEEQVTMQTAARNVAIDRRYARPGKDTVCVTATLTNPMHHTAVLSATVTDALGAVRDSVLLYNDGLHGDGAAGDSVWGNKIIAPSDEGIFTISVRTDDATQGTVRRLPNIAAFATCGPLTVDSVAISPFRMWYSVIPRVRNNGLTDTVRGASVKVSCNDPWVLNYSQSPLRLSEIPPGESANTIDYLTISYNAPSFPDYFNLKFDLAIDGYVCWSGSGKAVITEVKGGLLLPGEYVLHQNYPNPFNPSTTIKYELPKFSMVRLSLYDILGREISVLVNERKNAGTYEVQFDAAKLPSGVYFYRIQAGSFVETKKFVVLK